MAAFSANDLRTVEVAPAAPAGRVNPHARQLNELAEMMAQHRGRRIISATILEGLVRLGELGLTMIVGLITYLVVVVPVAGVSVLPLLALPLVSTLLVIVMQSLGCYRVSALRAPTRFGLRISVSWFAVFALTFGACWLADTGAIFDKAWLGNWTFFGFLAITAERFALALVTNYLTRTGKLSRRTVIVGGGPPAKQLLQDFAEEGSEDLHIFGIFDDRTDERSPDVVAGFPKLGNVDDLVAFARHTPLDLVIFTLPISAEQRLLVMLRKLWVLPVDIRLAAHMNKLKFRPRAYSYIGKVPVIDLFDKPLAEWDIVVKSIFDRLVGALALIALAPVMAAVAIAVKLDSKGPVLFRQKRYGFNNELIEVFKFRSMYTEQLDLKADKLVTKNDPRVTRVGRFIRKSSLDELPQLFNVVFKGNLSLVGPRPHAVHAKAAEALYDEVVDSYFARHRVRPGITGWAQIHGWRGETDTSEKIQKRVECDLFYIENWSIFLDLYVLLMTPISLVKTKNAY
jgi:Undecaprenyl-phosphate glucose phosphotransferase